MALFPLILLGSAVVVGLIEGAIPASRRVLDGFSGPAGTLLAVWLLVAVGAAVWTAIHAVKGSAEARRRRRGFAQRADYEHRQLMQGDVTRGAFGQYPPHAT